MRTTGALTALVVAATSALVVASAAPSSGADLGNAAAPSGRLAEAYTVEMLEPPGGGVSAGALGINNAGDVVGIARPTSSAQPQQTVLWARDGGRLVAHELANLEGSQFSRGFDLNDDRRIVGEAFNSGGGSIPIRWEGAAAPQHVTSLNEAGTGILNDINNDGVVVATASGRAHVVWADGEVTTLPAPEVGEEGATVNHYSATSIAEGDVVGGRVSIAEPHGDHSHHELYGVVWDEQGARLLDTPDGGSSPVVANVTPDGYAVGSSTVSTKESAVLWGADGTPAVLPIPGVADYTHAAAKSVADGVVVGNTSKFAGNTSFGGAATGWDAEGAVDLNTVAVDLPEGVTLQSASDINEAGQIVGTATTSAGARGFVLTPVSEPEEGEVTTISASPVLQVYGQSVDLAVEVSPQATGTVTLCAGARQVEADLVDGAATLTVPAGALRPGKRSVRVTYEGVPGEFQPSEATVDVTVSKAAAVVGVERLKPNGKKVARGSRLVVRVSVDAIGVSLSGKVVAKVAGIRQVVEVNRRGRAKVRLVVPAKAKRGTTQLRVLYRGDPHVARSTADPLRIRVVR
ncbi:Ig-like domain-containing protein [Nocardioides sp.]|uniref:Ig-like domain-containing protein n=1 Tax=Nocardioides sp. TaxID=35761 RepID=UPI0027362DC2|nr:Ig-like domain-containing protein [Nocardioides sp.]